MGTGCAIHCISRESESNEEKYSYDCSTKALPIFDGSLEVSTLASKESLKVMAAVNRLNIRSPIDLLDGATEQLLCIWEQLPCTQYTSSFNIVLRYWAKKTGPINPSWPKM